MSAAFQTSIDFGLGPLAGDPSQFSKAVVNFQP